MQGDIQFRLLPQEDNSTGLHIRQIYIAELGIYFPIHANTKFYCLAMKVHKVTNFSQFLHRRIDQ